MIPYPPFSDSGTATLLRGFGYQIATLKKPTIAVVQQIAEGIGLRVMREQEYSQMKEQVSTIALLAYDHIADDQQIIDNSINLVQKLKFILLSQMTDEERVKAISKLVINETISQ